MFWQLLEYEKLVVINNIEVCWRYGYMFLLNISILKGRGSVYKTLVLYPKRHR